MYKEKGKMIKETITRIKLTAAEGMILTDGESYGRVVYLATGESGERWQEVTLDEYEQRVKEESGIDQ